jgi:hypothetical protein
MGCLIAVKNNLPVLVKARVLAPQDNKKAVPSSPSTHLSLHPFDVAFTSTHPPSG